MKLRNKQSPNKLGEIVPYDAGKDGGIAVKTDQGIVWYYHSLAELSAEWEDYKEPKEYWFLSTGGEPHRFEGEDGIYTPRRKRIGNYFDTREEAEKAVEKLKAVKRLKDKGFRFEGIKEDYTRILQFQAPFRSGKRYLQFNKSEDEDWMKENWDDLDLLFGGKE